MSEYRSDTSQPQQPPAECMVGLVADTPRMRQQPLRRGGTQLTGGLLAAWQRRNRDHSIPHAVAQLERAGNLDNLKRLLGENTAPYRGPVFMDSDVYKTLEAIAWQLGHDHDDELRRFYDETVTLLERVQADDGYLNSNFQRTDREQEPWTDFAQGHELYCLGHLIQAGVTEARALREDRLLRVAQRFADLAVRLFGAEGTPVVPGHPEIEMALVELQRLTGETAYLQLASLLVDRRGKGIAGHGRFGPRYHQDDQPIRDMPHLSGHAVRALYLMSGVTDVYLETGDDSLLDALIRMWDDLTAKRMYITGGVGSRHRDEAIGDPYELPPDRAYAETCAAIALMQWAWRMFLATGEAPHMDVFEQVLYNGFAAATSVDGRSFFYSNTLQRRPDRVVDERTGPRRPWYGTACCPPNIMRTIATLETYLATHNHDSLTLCLYNDARITAEHPGGSRLQIAMETEYPWDGAVTVRVVEAPPRPHTITFRVPTWADRYEVVVNNEQDGRTRPTDGWLRLRRQWQPGDTVRVVFETPVCIIEPHPHIDAVRGCVAVTRGVLVYCLEQRHNDVAIDDLEIDTSGNDQPPTLDPGGKPTPTSTRVLLPARVRSKTSDRLPLYAPLPSQTASGPTDHRSTTAVFTPYHRWTGDDPMRVWVRR